MFDLYVYYKVREQDAARLEPLVRAMQARLAASTGAIGQLKRRPQAQEGLQTWMEVYPATDAAFPAALAVAEREAGIGDLLAGARHTELFTDLTPCA